MLWGFMQVIDILQTMALMSVGGDNLTPKTKAIFLRYLNLANGDIYNKTANINPDLLVNEQLQTNQDSEDVQLNQNPFLVSALYVENQYPGLLLKTFLDFIDFKKNYNGNGDPQVFTFRKDTVSISPIRANTQYNLDIWYTPQPIILDENTAENDIPYPLSFHDVLVNKALYYLFLDEDGFKDSRKSMEAKERSKDQEKDLISYLYANSNQTLGTFSNV